MGGKKTKNRKIKLKPKVELEERNKKSAQNYIQGSNNENNNTRQTTNIKIVRIKKIKEHKIRKKKKKKEYKQKSQNKYKDAIISRSKCNKLSKKIIRKKSQYT